MKAVSGQSLRAFTDSAIFRPLGMTHTHFHDDYTALEKGRAASYQTQSGAFHNAVLNYSTVGPSSLFTSVEDMSRWLQNFYAPKVGDQQALNELTRPGRLASGKALPYALGIDTTPYNGQTFYAHNGADAGFRTSVGVFPQLQLGLVVFSNLADVNPSSLMTKMADVLVKDAPKAAAKPLALDSSQASLPDTTRLHPFTGTYRSDDGAEFRFLLQRSRLYWVRSGRKDLLLKTWQDTFAVVSNPSVKFWLGGAPAPAPTIVEYWPGNERVLHKQLPPLQLPDQELQAYVGTYHCPELDCNYRIVQQQHRLLLTHSKYDDAPLTLASRHTLRSDLWWMAQLSVQRNRRGQITGFEVDNGRVRHRRFEKVSAE